MTVLDLTPPHPHLRLVSDNAEPDDAVPRDHRYRAAASLRGEARALYREVLSFALSNQTTIEPDALRVILATKQATSALPARSFTATGIWQLMFVDVAAWCRNRQLEVPHGSARALNVVLEMLDSTDGFDERSDEIHALYDAIDECTGGWWVDDSHPSSSSTSRRSLRSGRGPKRI